MNLFKSKTGIVSSSEFSNSLQILNLVGKNVIIYSRLLSLGRFFGKEAVIEFLEIILKHIGPEGTIIIPTYTLGCYKEPRIHDITQSVIMSGILGEVASKHVDFVRTVHPVYSNAISGKNTEFLLNQDATTCFGKDSLFDLFSKLENAYVMMIGLNFNGPTLYHYYDQKYNAAGRFVKYFPIKIKLGEYCFSMSFNSYVKDHDFYAEQMNCLGRFDALAEEFNLVKRVAIGDDWIHMISETDFQNLYNSVLQVDQNYFLMASNKDWEEYYMKNRFSVFHGSIDENVTARVLDLFSSLRN